MIKFIIIFLIASPILFAGDSFMEFWKAYDYGMLLSIMFLIIIIPIWMIVSLFTKNKSNRLFKSLILIDIAIFIISIISSSINQHIEAQNYKPSHEFQKPYEYGVYRNNVVAFEEQNDSIIDMYLEDYVYIGGSRNLSYLTKNGLLLCNQYIDTSIVDPMMAKCSDSSLILLSQTKDILYFDFNSEKFKDTHNEYILNIPNRLNLHDDYIENAHHKKYYEKGNRRYWSDYEELYLDHIDINDTKSIEKIGYHSFLSVMDKQNNEIIFYDNSYPIHKFKLINEPKLASYDWREDILYIVYKKDDSKIYELTNILSKPYTLAQNRVKTILNEVFQPWWKSAKIPYKGISQKDIDKLAKYFKDDSYMKFNYKVKQLDTTDTYEVEVTSYIKPTMCLLFQLDTNDTHTKIHSITYNKRYYKKELFQTLTKELVNTKTDFDLLKWLIKYESLLGNIKYEFALNNSDLPNGIKEPLVENIDVTMKNYLWNNVKKLNKNLNKRQEIKIFRKKYPCINQYLSTIQEYRKEYLNLPHPLTNTNIQKSLSRLFYFLNKKCKQIDKLKTEPYKNLFKAIDSAYIFKYDDNLNHILKKLNIKSQRFEDLRIYLLKF